MIAKDALYLLGHMPARGKRHRDPFPAVIVGGGAASKAGQVVGPKASEAQQKQKEGELIISKVSNFDILILLDENGKQLDSVGFSSYLQKHMNSGIKQLIFVIGGPYGFSEDVYKKAQGKLSLSKMTFSHQMVRLFFIEQLYRGFTILRSEPYHHN